MTDSIEVILISTGSHLQETTVENPTFTKLRKMIGTDIVELIPARWDDNEMLMLVDEEGLMKSRSPNLIASTMTGVPLVGDVLLAKVADLDAIPYE